MLEPRGLAPYFGFTGEEVLEVCRKHGVDHGEREEWYDGYKMVYSKASNFGFEEVVCSIYSPKSVVESLLTRRCAPYWVNTETYEALKLYIQMDFNGLREDVVAMLAGTKVPLNTRTFSNDMASFTSKDDVLTLLVHLGYLSFDVEGRTVPIPNKEVSEEFANTIEALHWDGVADALKNHSSC
ncbi:MAG: hypothetical protein FWG10_12615 [Eubacteriaceae bacterium]|nr:hypothetical protein [Eubacteriaceae bacterium]